MINSSTRNDHEELVIAMTTYFIDNYFLLGEHNPEFREMLIASKADQLRESIYESLNSSKAMTK